MKKKLLFIILYFVTVMFCFFIIHSIVIAYTDGTLTMYRDNADGTRDDPFDLTFTFTTANSFNVNGTMNYQSVNSDITVNSNYYDGDICIPVLEESSGTVYVYVYIVPSNSTYYCFNNGRWNNNGAFTSSFYCSSSYYKYNANTNTYEYKSAGSVDALRNYTSYCLCTTYTSNSLIDVEYEPTYVGYPDASFENYDDTTTYSNSLVTGEFTYFYIKVPKIDGVSKPCWLYLHDITNINPPTFDYVNNSSSVYIDLNDYTSNSTGNNYIWRYNSDDRFYYYAIPSVFPFKGYLNNHTYKMYLQWSEGENTTVKTKEYTWTTNFSQAGIVKQAENLNDKTLTQQDQLYNYLTQGDISNDIINLPTLNVSDPTYSFFSSLVFSITDAFYTATNEETISFYAYNNEYIINSADFTFLNISDLIALKNLLSIMWVVGVGMYLYTDIRKEITRLKEFGWSALFADDISIDIM